MMSNSQPLNAELLLQTCLCLQVQRANRAIGRRFDEAFRSFGLNNWQFSLLMMLNQPEALSVGELADQLSMDRTTTSCNLKPLEKRGYLTLQADTHDARIRRVFLTNDGRNVLEQAAIYWQKVNEQSLNELGDIDVVALRSALENIASMR